MWLPLVVGVDGSIPSLLALDWAVDEAARLGVPLKLVHASLEEGFARSGGAVPDASPAVRDDPCRAVVAVAEERAHRRHPGVKVSAEVVSDDAVTALLDRGRNASALILGARGRGELENLLLGSVSLSVAARAQCPVVVVRDGDVATGDRNGNVVLGVADATSTSAAARFAFQLADARRCPLDAVMAWQLPTRALSGSHIGPSRPDRRDHLRALLDEALAEPVREFPAVGVRRFVIDGLARDVLLKRSATAGILVVGAQRRRSRIGLYLGRVNHALLHYAGCPVAVVPQWH